MFSILSRLCLALAMALAWPSVSLAQAERLKLQIIGGSFPSDDMMINFFRAEWLNDAIREAARLENNRRAQTQTSAPSQPSASQSSNSSGSGASQQGGIYCRSSSIVRKKPFVPPQRGYSSQHGGIISSQLETRPDGRQGILWTVSRNGQTYALEGQEDQDGDFRKECFLIGYSRCRCAASIYRGGRWEIGETLYEYGY